MFHHLIEPEKKVYKWHSIAHINLYIVCILSGLRCVLYVFVYYYGDMQQAHHRTDIELISVVLVAPLRTGKQKQKLRITYDFYFTKSLTVHCMVVSESF